MMQWIMNVEKHEKWDKLTEKNEYVCLSVSLSVSLSACLPACLYFAIIKNI